jgi:hypothetical protein
MNRARYFILAIKELKKKAFCFLVKANYFRIIIVSSIVSMDNNISDNNDLDNYIEENFDTALAHNTLAYNNMKLASDAHLHRYLITNLQALSNMLQEALLISFLQ